MPYYQPRSLLSRSNVLHQSSPSYNHLYASRHRRRQQVDPLHFLPYYTSTPASTYSFDPELTGQLIPPFCLTFAPTNGSTYDQYDSTQLLLAGDEDGYIHMIDHSALQSVNKHYSRKPTTNSSDDYSSVAELPGLGRWRSHENAIFDVQYVVDGSGEATQIVTCSGDQTAKVWDLVASSGGAGVCTATFAGHAGSVKCVTQHKHTTHLFASGARDGSIALWDSRCSSSSGAVASFTSAPTHRQMHAHYNPQHAAKRSRASHKLLQSNRSHDALSVTDVLFLPHTEYLLASCSAAENAVRLWDIRYLPTHTVKPDDQPASAGVMLPTESAPASNAAERDVSAAPTASAKKRSKPVKQSASSAKSVSNNTSLYPQSAKYPHRTGPSKHGLTSLSTDRAGGLLCVSCQDNSVYLYDLSPASLATAPNPTITTSRFDTTASVNGTRPTSSCVARFTGHINKSFYVKSAISADGQYIISGSVDRKVYIWSTEAALKHYKTSAGGPPPSYRPIAALSGHAGETTAVAWSPAATVDGLPKFASIGDDAMLRVWTVDWHQYQHAVCSEPDEIVPTAPTVSRATTTNAASTTQLAASTSATSSSMPAPSQPLIHALNLRPPVAVVSSAFATAYTSHRIEEEYVPPTSLEALSQAQFRQLALTNMRRVARLTAVVEERRDIDKVLSDITNSSSTTERPDPSGSASTLTVTTSSSTASLTSPAARTPSSRLSLSMKRGQKRGRLSNSPSQRSSNKRINTTAGKAIPQSSPTAKQLRRIADYFVPSPSPSPELDFSDANNENVQVEQ